MSAPHPTSLTDPPDWASEERISGLRANADRHAASSREETIALLETAQLRPGLRVLDIACGSGDPTLEIAARISPGGHVTGIDLSEGAVGVARERAQRAQLAHIDFQSANVESLPFGDRSFDCAVSRFGAMYFDDLSRAFGEVHRVLRPQGRIALMVWGPFDQPYFECTVGVLLHHLGWKDLPPSQSAPFRFDERGVLETEVARAGFREVEDQTRTPNWV